MDSLNTMMVILTLSVAALMIPRIMVDWQRCREFLLEGDEESLRRLAADQKTWIVRHGICALGAIVMVVLIKYLPGMTPYEELAGPVTAYGMMTLSLAFFESLLAQRVENRLLVVRASARQAREFGR